MATARWVTWHFRLTRCVGSVWRDALFEGDLLTDESLAEMLTVDSNVFGLDYGLGTGVLYPPDGTGNPMFGHWGQYGWEAGVMYDPVTHRAIVILVEGDLFLTTLWDAVDALG